MTVYYNEHDPFAAAWLRELIKANLIAPGEVDERSIEDVKPDELRGFTQCHFFAGIGVWSYALRKAGWPDDTPVWTGSCPCQSFSQSGKGEGFSDKRHLWPAWFRLIGECRPDRIFGEQVSGANGLAWFDVVSSELEGIGYTVGALSTTAAGVGAPHIRSRLYFVAHGQGERCEGQRLSILTGESRQARIDTQRNSETSIVGNAESEQTLRQGSGRLQSIATQSSPISGVVNATESRRERNVAGEVFGGWDSTGKDERITGSSSIGESAHADSSDQADVCGSERRRSKQRGISHGSQLGHASEQGLQRATTERALSRREVATGHAGSSGCNGFWHDAEWIYCKDGKYRPVKPGLPVLVTRSTNRVGRLRGYGNALCAETAKAFIEAYMDISR